MPKLNIKYTVYTILGLGVIAFGYFFWQPITFAVMNRDAVMQLAESAQKSRQEWINETFSPKDPSLTVESK